MRILLRRNDDGFALISVLLALGLLGAVAAGFTLGARSEIREVAAAVRRAKAENIADAGIHLAILELLGSRENQNRTRSSGAGGSSTTCRIGSATIEISVTDEAGRVDLNAAPASLLDALFRGAGAEPAAATEMARALVAYRSTDRTQMPDAAVTGAKNAPLNAFEELFAIQAAPAAFVSELRPLVTVHSGQSGLDPGVASPVLLRTVLAGAGRRDAFQSAEADTRSHFRRQLPHFVTVSQRKHFRVRATGRVEGAAFVREAVVEIIPGRVTTYAMRTWQQGIDIPSASASSDGRSC